VSWFVSGNVLTRLGLTATIAVWATIPVLWSINTWGVLSLVEVYWLLLVVLAWMFALGGLTQKGALEEVLPVTVFVWSSVIPTVLALLLVLSYTLAPGSSGGID
jgi:hypothetical protein